jgi:hypothetical protein
MERELWSEVCRRVEEVERTWAADPPRLRHRTAAVARVYLWAALHDRPVSWACEPDHWQPWARAGRWREPPLPTQSTMSRRARGKPFAAFLAAVGVAFNAGRRVGPVKWLDGKALPVAAHSKDRDARWGRGAGQRSDGYKLHALGAGLPMPLQWAVTDLSVDERVVAARFYQRLDGWGYVLEDALYDGSPLHARARAANHQMVAPRRRPGAGLGHRRHDPGRLRSLDLTEGPGPAAGGTAFGSTLHAMRDRAERDFGNLTSFGGGLQPLPAWARRIWRVRAWVHAKLLVNAARICRLERRRETAVRAAAKAAAASAGA